MADLINGCWFTSGTSGTGDFTDGAALQGYMNLDDAGAVGGKTYPYRAENETRTEWEIGYGVYSSGTGKLTRAPLRSSNSNAAVNFKTAPTVMITVLSEDIMAPITEALALPEVENDPSTPSAGTKLLYAKDDGKVYTRSSTGAVVEVGAGGGGSAYQIVPSVGSGALTIAIKNAAGNDPDSENPVTFDFRAETLTAGANVTRDVTAALSLVLSAGSTLGAANAIPFRLWIVAFDDAGTVRLGAIKCTMADGFYALSEWALASSTAEGGAGGADSAGVFYTGTAVSSKPYKILGFMDWDSGLVTAGTWAAGPSRVQIYERGMPLPGQEIGNAVRGVRTTQDYFTSTTYVNTNLTASIQLRSPCNAVAGVAIGALAVGDVGAGATVAVRRGGAVVNLSQSFYGAVANFNAVSVIPILDFPGATGPHTYTVAVKSSTGPVYYPGATTAESGATISLSEVMG